MLRPQPRLKRKDSNKRASTEAGAVQGQVRAKRGTSQVLFGMLPAQTVDLEGSVWRVKRWSDPVQVPLDQTSVRGALLEAAAPWISLGNDGGLEGELRAQAAVEVVSVNEDRGVVVEQFPRQWRCRSCGRLYAQSVDVCRCGSHSLAQMQHVAYHVCGALQEPILPRCPAHHSVAVRLPGTAQAREMYFFCPDCHRPLSPHGFPFQPCACGAAEGMTRNVHRAAAVFTPQYAILVNPPDPAAAARLRASGGGARALEWVVDGLGPTRPGEGRQTYEGLVETLLQSRLSLETARHLARQAMERGEVSAGVEADLDLPDSARTRSQEEALSLASALDLGRVRIDEMAEEASPPLRSLYEGAYRDAIGEARLSNVEFLSNFPVATLAYAFTRGGSDPANTRLCAFRDRGRLRAYGTLTKTEAILFQVDPVAVTEWLTGRGFDLPIAGSPREARLNLIRALDIPRPTDQQPQALGAAALTLLHSYAHRLIRLIAVTAGVERDGLAEYLLPHHLSIVVYASSRGQFVLGALQVLFETSLHRLLDDFVHGESRCPLDPGCQAGGGACMACLHLGEPSCRWFNRFLDRRALFGPNGFLAASRERR